VLNIEQNETWRPIKGFEKLYEVSTLGNISNYRKILKPQLINSGYYRIMLAINGIKYYYLVHRIVAETFIDNPKKLREVNHIDGDKLNNTFINLEWVSSKDNKKHAKAIGLTVYNIPTKGLKLGYSSKFSNVSYDANRKKWIGSVRHEGKNHYQRRFDTELEAALHVNWILDKLNITDRPRNFIQLNA
jgi:hypothetical protein